MKRVALITGVAGGIGMAIAEAFTKAGWHVAGVDKRDAESLVHVPNFILADISELDAPARIMAEVEERHGRLDALVNNAAVQICKPLLETTAQEWELTMNSNVRSAFFLMQAAYFLLKRSGGAIVNISSVHAMATSEGLSPYVASKGALLALTRAAAVEMGKDGIRVNAILPGAVDTHMLREGLRRGKLEGETEEDLLQALGARHVMGRVGLPKELGQAVLFLADNDQASFITGQTLVVDGGATAKLSTE